MDEFIDEIIIMGTSQKKKKTTLINPQTAVLIWWTEQKFLQNQTVFEHLDDS